MASGKAAAEPLGRTAEEVAWAEALRGACEPEHHWRHRREFLLRNVGEPPAAGSAQLQRLVSLSMVWANHVFLGCRYPPQVMEKALEMAEGIQVTDAPIRTTRDELVAKVKKRGISSSNEGVEEPPKKRAVEKSKNSKDTGKDMKTSKAEAPKETESTLPKKQEKHTSKDPESSQLTCSSDQEMVEASDIETEGKPANAENTTGQNPSSFEKESGEKPCSSPLKESKCEDAPSPEKKTTVSAVPPAAKSALQAEVVAAVVPPAAKSAPQAAAVPVAAKSAPQAEAFTALVPLAAKSTSQAETVTAVVPPAAAKSNSQAATVTTAVPPTTKSPPQAAAVPPTTKSTPQAAAVPPTTKSTPQTSATLLSSKNQASAPASVSKSSAQAGTSLLLAPKSSTQVASSLLLAPKGGAQAGTSLLLASKGTAKAGSSLLASKSSAEVAASLLAARSGAQQGSSLLTSKNSAQVAASLLGTRGGTQQGPSSLASRGGAQAGASLLASKGGMQAGSPQLASKSGLQAGESPAKALCKPLTSEDAKERQPFFNRLYKAVAWKLVAVGGFSPNVNHVELLNSSIQSVKATLDVAFVPLKELADLPQNKSSLENIVCELRCKSVYLGTGCGKSMENAKAVASREALKLFLKKKVIVKICKRKYKGSEIEDLVLLDEESKPSNLPPALRNPREIL
ncbi:CDKN2A-interacting protein isoform A [Patagioenas fasciata monilis]|uniref:CDKN2A-interacting protein isoform A n=1 Tax=Patagioenas fasciata monilis TaxID=372326 RepID=A0A1V4JHL4_PATFA|nr:CDKN2A-interacting protein isoform A [Patagioenas fasciata monilis]